MLSAAQNSGAILAKKHLEVSFSSCWHSEIAQELGWV
jgi:hypothetical protein